MKKLTLFAFVCISILIVMVSGGLWWLIQNYFETGKPVIRLNQHVRAVGRPKTISLTCTDKSSGLREIRVSVAQDNTDHLVASDGYPQRGTREKTLSVTVDPVALRLREGAAKLLVSVTDYSLLKNESTFEQAITIDLRPPRISLLNPVNNISPGGVCVIVYKTSEPTLHTGVRVGKRFFPGSPTVIAGKQVLTSFIALPVDAEKSKTPIQITASDAADNESLINVPFLLKNKRFRSDRMTLGDNFLQRKMPEFEGIDPSLRGKSPLDIFRYLNERVRINNEQFIQSIGSTITPKQLWQGSFLRMKNASPMALFGDRRTYLYRGKTIGGSIHLGVDLASTAHAPIEAANRGTVVFTGTLGIYGNTIIIDHGIGIHSLYGHLSAINVRRGQTVKRGETIGVSGATGLAAGDHLHFSILVGGQFVNPQEWWDAHWIGDNVSRKMEALP